MKKTSLLLLICGIFGTLSAQRGWELGGWVGASNYFGDLNTDYDLSHIGLAGGAIARYNFNERICFKLSANYGQLAADDANSSNPFERSRNLSFQSVVADGAAQLEFNFLPYFHGSQEQFFTPYLFGGIGFFYFNPKTEYEGELVELRPLGTEGQFRGEEYFSTAGSLVYGGGVKVDLSYEWSLNFMLSARKLFTDFVDDVSGTYPDVDDLENLRGQIAVDLSNRSIPIAGVPDTLGDPGQQRGDSSNKDTYVFLGVGLVYYFGDLRCPDYGK